MGVLIYLRVLMRQEWIIGINVQASMITLVCSIDWHDSALRWMNILGLMPHLLGYERAILICCNITLRYGYFLGRIGIIISVQWLRGWPPSYLLSSVKGKWGQSIVWLIVALNVPSWVQFLVVLHGIPNIVNLLLLLYYLSKLAVYNISSQIFLNSTKYYLHFNTINSIPAQARYCNNSINFILHNSYKVMISKINQNQKLYFQTQKGFSNDCGLCAINNLIGCDMYTAKDLTKLCNSLSNDFINPYKSIFGGDFDVSALILALTHLQLNVRWLKKGQQVRNVLSCERFKGFLINTSDSDYKYMKKIFGQSGKHWTCIKRVNNKFYFFDSKQKQPRDFDDQVDVENFVEGVRQSGGIILIVQSEVPHQKQAQNRNQQLQSVIL